ncbi:hypothetical protein EDB83DRAFT_2547427 [Lactarius deliciosus]|nr:hypothetical protein EDB83DRAFT_2547427 [Lactarius deliciosus]
MNRELYDAGHLSAQLFACVLDCQWIPSIDLQQATSSLLRFFPYGFIPDWRRYLFYHIHLKSANNVWMLSKHLRRIPGDADFVKKFSLATWTVDADAAINVILMIPKLEWLSHWHKFRTRAIEARLSRANAKIALPFSPVSTLRAVTIFSCNSRYLALRRALAISVVQDPLDVPTSSSAQPLVFFHFNHLSAIASSLLLARTQAPRLRIPGRELVSINARRSPPTGPSTYHFPRPLDLPRQHCRHEQHPFAASRTSATSSSTNLLDTAHYDVNRHLAATPGAGESHPRELRVRDGVLTLRFPWPGDVSHALRELGLPRMMAVDDDDEFARLSVLWDREANSVVCPWTEWEG